MSDPDEEVRKIKLALYEGIKIYTQLASLSKILDLKNHISYWLLISLLIEKSMIEDLDEEYISSLEEQEQAPFFIFEESLKFLSKYLRKLVDWYNSPIFLFYF